MEKYIYSFNEIINDKIDPAEILGNKGSGLNLMTNLGLPVPQGFTISTRVCLLYTSPSPRDRG